MKFKKIVLCVIFIGLGYAYSEPAWVIDTVKPLPTSAEMLKKSDDLCLLCKIWGFLKYHHPVITKGQLDWDQELIKMLPDYIATHSIKERNALLEKWIKNLGRPSLQNATNDIVLKNIKLFPNYAWITHSRLSKSVENGLIELKNINAKGDQFYIKFESGEGVTIPEFINEKYYSNSKELESAYKLLSVFRYWNIIEYWYPYRYLLADTWDNNLKRFIKEVLKSKNDEEYVLFIRRMIASIKDTHAVVYGLKVESSIGLRQMPFTLKIIGGQAVVASINSNFQKGQILQVGNIVKSIDHVTIKHLLAKVKPYVSASNEAVVRRESAKLLTRTNDTTSKIVFLNNSSQQHTLTVRNNIYHNSEVHDFPYQKDSSYFVIKHNILYINVGTIRRSQIVNIKALLTNVKGIILDNRQYPKHPAGDLISKLLLPHRTPLNLFSSLVEGYPGVFRLTKPVIIGSENPEFFKGKVIILVNEDTQSTGEYFTMAFKLSPNATIIGTATAGADGNVCPPFPLPGGVFTQITALGVYYPDGRETQQIGITPDIKVAQTIKGLRNHVDELLERAINIINNSK